MYAFSQNRQNGEFEKLNVSLTALYFLVEQESGEYDEEIRNAVIEAAKTGRVTYQMAVQIAKDTANALREAQPAEKGRNKIASAQNDDADHADADEVPDEADEAVIGPEATTLSPEDDEDDAVEERWQGSLGNYAADATAMCAAWKRDFGDWENFDCPSDLMTLAKQAAQAWTELVAHLSKSKATDVVKSAADRAEAKAAGKMH